MILQCHSFVCSVDSSIDCQIDGTFQPLKCWYLSLIDEKQVFGKQVSFKKLIKIKTRLYRRKQKNENFTMWSPIVQMKHIHRKRNIFSRPIKCSSVFISIHSILSLWLIRARSHPKHTFFTLLSWCCVFFYFIIIIFHLIFYHTNIPKLIKLGAVTYCFRWNTIYHTGINSLCLF